MLTELYQLSSLLLFLPGILVLEVLNERFQLKMVFLERVVAGSLIWNFFFCSASILLGIFPHLREFFWAFGYLSAFLLLICFVLKLTTLKKFTTVTTLKESVMGSYLFPIVLTSSIIAMFTTVSASWDVWAFFLPMAKSILKRGDLLFNEYFLSKESMAVHPPYIPLVYAWTSLITGGDYYRFIPIIYYVLFGVTNYLLSITLLESKKIALGATVISMSSLITLATLFGYTLHPDLPTAFFICSSMMYVGKILKGKKSTHNLLLLGISVSLLMLTKVIGLFIGYVIMTFILLCTSIPYKKPLFTLFFISPFFILLLYQNVSQKFPLILVYLVITMIIVKRMTIIKMSLKVTDVLKVLLPFLPALIYFLIIGQHSGIWLYTFISNTDYLQARNLRLDIISGGTQQVQITILNVLRLDDIFLKYCFIIYIPLILFEFIYNFKEKKIEKGFLSLMMVTFLCIFLIYPKHFYPSFSPTDVAYIRRYMYFLPLISILASKGFYQLLDIYVRIDPLRPIRTHSSEPSISLTSFILYNAFSTLFILKRIEERLSWPRPLNSIFDISILRVSIGWNDATFFDIFILVIFLFMCLQFRSLITGIHKMQRRQNLKKMYSLSLLSLVFVSSFSIIYSLHKPLIDVSIYGTQSRYILPIWSGIDVELINFFDGLEDEGTVIGFSKFYIATFSDRKVIDLSTDYGFKIFLNIFQNADLNDLIARLDAKNVKYIIEPTEKNNMEYEIFNEYKRKFPLFENLFKIDSLLLLKSFDNYKVYELPTIE